MSITPGETVSEDRKGSKTSKTPIFEIFKNWGLSSLLTRQLQLALFTEIEKFSESLSFRLIGDERRETKI